MLDNWKNEIRMERANSSKVDFDRIYIVNASLLWQQTGFGIGITESVTPGLRCRNNVYC